MNKKERINKRREIWSKYHVPGCTGIHKVKINAVFISLANTLEHELKKLEICYQIKAQGHYFITEAMRNKKDRKGRERRVDIINLDTGEEYEIETDKRRAGRFKGEKGVIVVMVSGIKEKKNKNLDKMS